MPHLPVVRAVGNRPYGLLWSTSGDISAPLVFIALAGLSVMGRSILPGSYIDSSVTDPSARPPGQDATLADGGTECNNLRDINQRPHHHEGEMAKAPRSTLVRKMGEVNARRYHDAVFC